MIKKLKNKINIIEKENILLKLKNNPNNSQNYTKVKHHKNI